MYYLRKKRKNDTPLTFLSIQYRPFPYSYSFIALAKLVIRAAISGLPSTFIRRFSSTPSGIVTLSACACQRFAVFHSDFVLYTRQSWTAIAWMVYKVVISPSACDNLTTTPGVSLYGLDVAVAKLQLIFYACVSEAVEDYIRHPCSSITFYILPLK